MMKNRDINFKKRLIEAKTYREFLSVFFKKDNNINTRYFSYQYFANKAGFSSRSFISDIIAGRKRVTLSSFDKIVTGLSLNNAWAEYFRCLITIEEEKFRIGNKTEDFYQKRLKELRLRLSINKKIVTYKNIPHDNEVIFNVFFTEIYASLGSSLEGASFDEVVSRSRVEKTEALKILEEMKRRLLIIHDSISDRYRPNIDSISFNQLNTNEYFEKDFLRSLEKARMRFSKQASLGQSLFMTQTFSVSSSRLTELKVELAKIIESFSEEAENYNGDTIAEVCISFTNNMN